MLGGDRVARNRQAFNALAEMNASRNDRCAVVLYVGPSLKPL